MIRANKLTQLEGLQNVGEFGDFGEILPRRAPKEKGPEMVAKWWRKRQKRQKRRFWRNFAKAEEEIVRTIN